MSDSSKITGKLHRVLAWIELILVYGLIECALWSQQPSTRNRFALVALIAVIVFIAVDLLRPDHTTVRRLGLGMPTTTAAGIVLAATLGTTLFFVLGVRWAGGAAPINGTWPSVSQSWAYVLWAFLQEFVLQSFFFTRCEDLFGSETAPWVAATLFAAAHLPSPLLTTFTFIAALFFCEVFMRNRSIYPIALMHAVLGLIVGATMPDSLLHHMRVGIGYLKY